MPVIPLYQRVAADLRDQIRTGQLKPGDKLPTAVEMQKIYGVGSTAIRNAMLLLRAEGLVEGHQGKAVYVAPAPTGG